jgi:hypothetical protein
LSHVHSAASKGVRNLKAKMLPRMAITPGAVFAIIELLHVRKLFAAAVIVRLERTEARAPHNNNLSKYRLHSVLNLLQLFGSVHIAVTAFL